MKKVFALLSVVAVFAFASCEDKKSAEGSVDTLAVVPVADSVAPVVADSVAPVVADSVAPAKH